MTGRNNPSQMLVALTVLALAWCVPPATATMFTGLGYLPGAPSDWLVSEAYGISADGSVVVGVGRDSTYTLEAFRWTTGGGMTALGELTSGAASFSRGVSTDGATVAGYGRQWEAMRWQSGVMTGLGSLLGDTASEAFGISGDGGTVVGRSWSGGGSDMVAIRWTQLGGMESLGVLPGGTTSVALGASADGTVIVGESLIGANLQAFRWTGGTMTNLGGTSSSARAVSADGAVVAGVSSGQMFRWTQAGGMVSLGFPAGFSSSAALGMSADGNVIVGQGTEGLYPRALIWDSVNGMRSVSNVLVSAGIDLTGWALVEATGASSDGRFITGWGYSPDGGTQAWLADLAPAAVPEMSTVWLLVLGVGLVGSRWYRRR